MKKVISAYPKTEEQFRSNLSLNDIDHSSFNRLLTTCNIQVCQGMCCYDGVYVNSEEEEVLRAVWRSRKDFFISVGIDTSEDPITETEWRGHKRCKTRVKPKAFSSIVDNYPSFFSDTACVFLTNEGYCSLQLLSISEDKHKWYYKPLTCSLHPISISFAQRRAFLATEENDPHKSDDYPGYVTKTHCGAICNAGNVASEVLKEELQYLKDILA